MWHDELTEQLMRVRATFHKGGEYAYYDKITEGEKVWFYPDGHHVEQLEEYVLEPLENIRFNSLEIDDRPARDCFLIRDAICLEYIRPFVGAIDADLVEMLMNEIDIGGFSDFLHYNSHGEIKEYALELVSANNREATFTVSWEFALVHSYWDSDDEPDIRFTGFVADVEKWEKNYREKQKRREERGQEELDRLFCSAESEWEAVRKKEEKSWPRGGIGLRSRLKPCARKG